MKNEEQIKVSIIVPVHNAADTVDSCVNSIIRQSYKNIECILVENGSNDESLIRCQNLATKFTNVITISNEESGVSNARNKGLSLATGNVIGFCDADDFLEPEAIKLVVNEFLNNNNIAGVFGGFYIGSRDTNGILKKTYSGTKTQKIPVSKALQLTLIDDLIMGSVWNKYYKKEALENIYFDPSLSFCEDMHFNVKVLDSIQSSKTMIKVISDPLYCYMENFKSVTHTSTILFDSDNELKYITALKRIEKDCMLDRNTKALVKMKTACFSIDFLTNMDLDGEKKQKLYIELKKNYVFLLRYITKNNWKWNVKRAFKGLKILLTWEGYR